MRQFRNFGRKAQGGWVQLIGAAISAAAAAKAASDARRQRLAAQESATQQSDQNVQLQREFAQHGIQWRVADAKAAGLHPVFALSGGGASYTPQATQVFQDNSPAYLASMGQTLGNAFNQYMASRGSPSSDSRELYGPPDHLFQTAHAYAIPPQGDEIASTLHPYSPQNQPPVGMTNFAANPAPSSKYWSVPEFGTLILPDAPQFSEALEGLDSITGQGMYLYINRETLGVAAEKALHKLLSSVYSGVPALQTFHKFFGSNIVDTMENINRFSMGRKLKEVK